MLEIVLSHTAYHSNPLPPTPRQPVGTKVVVNVDRQTPVDKQALPKVDTGVAILYSIDNGTYDLLNETFNIPVGKHTITLLYRYSPTPNFKINLSFLKDCLTDVTYWDMALIGSLCFEDCANLKSVPATLPTSLVSAKDMFTRCKVFNQDISNWDVSKVTDMSGMFMGAVIFDQPIQKWDTSSLTQMNYMFDDAKVFNRDLTHWRHGDTISFTYFDQGADAWENSHKPSFTQ